MSERVKNQKLKQTKHLERFCNRQNIAIKSSVLLLTLSNQHNCETKLITLAL